ncbi:putative enoyl-CoA hydratase [Planctomycetes bacterium Pla163]|jgi:enoyl-CoA hydratase|uniref:Putative enoyl-CoA hydratase n=1 Tax=Rohdeia mirabilis TaxID=2528008 RepID=A0A518CWP9_9BACT|nr:putative enoyl-CoA hydratase [Planctomycetes bacterium Pla163]
MPTLADLSEPESFAHGRVTWRSGAGVCLLTLTNPPANGYSYEMMRDLDEAVLRARMDTAVEVIVLAGASEKFFCAGADIGMLDRLDPDFKYAFCLHANETLLRLEHTPKLVVAALGGHCVGGGLEVAMAADLRWARADSGKCGLPEVALGVLPGTGGTQRLSRIVGKSRSIAMMASGELVGYARAQELGLVDEVIAADDDASFLDAVLDRIGAFLRPGHSSTSVGLIKRAVQTGWELPLEAGLALERELQARLFASDDAKEGLAAFVEKRPARFEGK